MSDPEAVASPRDEHDDDVSAQVPGASHPQNPEHGADDGVVLASDQRPSADADQVVETSEREATTEASSWQRLARWWRRLWYRGCHRDERMPVRGKAMFILGWIVTAVILVCALGSLVPDLLGGLSAGLQLSTHAPFTQVLAVRSALVLMFAVVSLVLAVVAVVRWRRHDAGRRMILIAVVFMLVAGVHTWVLMDRGLHQPGQVRPTVAKVADADSSDWDGRLTVLSFNTYMGRAKVIDLALEIRHRVPDVVVLLETEETDIERLLSLTKEDGLSYLPFSAGDEHSGLATTVLISAAIGEYEQASVEGMGHGAVYLTPVGDTQLNGHRRPVILGVHTIAPLPSTMSLWKDSVETVVDRCRPSEPGLVVAGDFNATLDHAVMRDLGGCVDAGVQAGVGGLATWPTTTRTALFGASIDHVLVDEKTWQATAAEVIELAGSDHRALAVELTER